MATEKSNRTERSLGEEPFWKIWLYLALIHPLNPINWRRRKARAALKQD